MKLEKNVEILSGFAFKSNLFNTEGLGIPLIRIRDVTSNSVSTYFNGNYKDEFIVENGDLLVGMDGQFNLIEWRGGKALLNQRVCKIIPDLNKIDKNFIKYLVPKALKEIEDKTSFVTVKHLTVKKIKDIILPKVPIETQKRIAQILDDAAALRDKTRQLVKEYDALAQSIFLEMFGDPVRNEKGWEKEKLGRLGIFKNGLNYSKSENGNRIKVIGVGDFKSFSEIKNLDHISFIEMTELPKDDFLLKDEDLLFVRSNGNKELVGRCLMVFVGDEKVSYSGFCIRFRKSSSLLNTVYLVQLFQRKEFKKHVFKNGRGANIQNINQELLNNIDFQLPPIDLQKQFAEKITLIEQQKELAKQELKESEDLFNCLLQKAFKGELT
ncbi:restriction endonuclease subunit S [Chryseobacterium sp. 8AT]|uniref:restriction endonuclease subunit S n=1 Tax=Chryseobacterium sp. 8AT TaxID=2653134 RepID=UPI0012EEF7F1|nr:restriction endonuclease subunit S [Chryseobacterium sp. 8AT]VXC57667.1 Restriction modification system DNA specificity domain protein [Chryseobacterium sp. 8AT]